MIVMSQFNMTKTGLWKKASLDSLRGWGWGVPSPQNGQELLLMVAGPKKNPKMWHWGKKTWMSFWCHVKSPKKSTSTVTQLKDWLQSKVQRKEHKERLMEAGPNGPRVLVESKEREPQVSDLELNRPGEPGELSGFGSPRSLPGVALSSRLACRSTDPPLRPQQPRIM